MASKAYLSAVAGRRSYYQISNKTTIEPSAIKAIVEEAVKYTPSPYNTQSSRAILLLDDASRTTWGIVKEHLLNWLPEGDEAMAKMHSEKVAGFASGYGTVLFFEDQETIDASNTRMAQFRHLKLFESWADTSSGMLQHMVWTALETEGFGASLQHHATFIDGIQKDLQEKFGYPASWKCTALMPFGVPTGGPGQPGMPPKTFRPIEERVKTFSSVPQSAL